MQAGLGYRRGTRVHLPAAEAYVVPVAARLLRMSGESHQPPWPLTLLALVAPVSGFFGLPARFVRPRVLLRASADELEARPRVGGLLAPISQRPPVCEQDVS